MYKFPHKVLKYPLCQRFTNSTQNYENTQCVCQRCTYSLQSTKTLSCGRTVWTIEYTCKLGNRILSNTSANPPPIFCFSNHVSIFKSNTNFQNCQSKTTWAGCTTISFKWRERVFISVEWISKYHSNNVKSLLMSFLQIGPAYCKTKHTHTPKML